MMSDAYSCLRSIVRQKNPKLAGLNLISYGSNYVLVSGFIIYLFFLIRFNTCFLSSFVL